jgi:hypothetical protein
MKLQCALVALTLSACVNPHSQFYRPGIDAKTMPSYVPVSGPLRSIPSRNENEVRGYPAPAIVKMAGVGAS